VVSVLFALLTALFNGLASVLQRMAASTAPAAKALHLSLFGYLIRHKVWLVGIGMVVLASVCQATALATGPVALVQPIFIIELPFTLLVASKLAHRKLPRMTWYAVGLVTVALGAGLAAAQPSGGGDHASIRVWTLTLIVTAVFEAVLIAVGVRAGGNARAATFGLAAACGYALTATLMKSAVSTLDHHGFVAFLSTWELYGTAVAGVGALFLLQNALQAGSLVAVQPPLTLGDALISACYGVSVFGEDVQTAGWLLAAEIVAVIAVAIGCIELSRSLAMVHVPQSAELPVCRRFARVQPSVLPALTGREPGADRIPGRGRPAGRLAPARRHHPPVRSPRPAVPRDPRAASQSAASRRSLASRCPAR
jgi:drug/metabolite transporter (DMT)-like permease